VNTNSDLGNTMNSTANDYVTAGKNFIFKHFPSARNPFIGKKIVLATRSCQQLFSLILWLIMCGVNFNNIENINYLFGTSSYKFMLAIGIFGWLYSGCWLLLQIKQLASVIPPKMLELVAGKETLIVMGGDFVMIVFTFSGSIAAVNALYTSVCGGNFLPDECFTLLDVCEMSARGNPHFATFLCPNGVLNAAVTFTFFLLLLFTLSFYLSYRTYRGLDKVEGDEPLSTDADGIPPKGTSSNVGRKPGKEQTEVEV